MLNQFIDLWTRISRNASSRWRWLGRALTVFAFIYLAGLIYYGGLQIGDINWGKYWWVSIIVLFLYLLSLIIQFLIWSRLIHDHHKIGLIDVAIYGRSILMRRLPGGVWHWVGRTALYSSQELLSSKTTIGANFLEWALLLLSGGLIAILGYDGIHPVLGLILSVVLISLSLLLVFRWLPVGKKGITKMFEGSIWLIGYLSAWSLGGLILYIVAIAVGESNLSLLRATWIWAISGSISMFIIFIPAGLGIREITITWLLAQYMPVTVAVLIAILIRLIFTISDLIWGSLSVGVSTRILNQGQQDSSTISNTDS